MFQVKRTKTQKGIILGGLALFFCLLSSRAYAINQPPQAYAVTPSVGSSQTGLPLTFAATYKDPDGWKNIWYVRLLINTTPDAKNGVLLQYSKYTKKVYLRNDEDTGWLRGFPLGSKNTIENSSAVIDCSGTTISLNDTTLTISWVIKFKDAFTGKKNIYLYVEDDQRNRDGWVQKGTWTIRQNQSPVINSITPTDYSIFLAGARINIQINASDPDNDPIEYQFSVGGALKQPWSLIDTYNWFSSKADTGAVAITCEVRDKKGATTVKTLTYRILNPSAEEILQKVAENYAKIQDFSADIALFSTLNGQPFGTTEYCRYYFKAPNKEKTESFTDASRTTKTEVIIIDGSTLHLLDPINNIRQQVDLLADAGIDSEQFNQMDIYYNLPNFLNNHTVTKNNSQTDFLDFILALDAFPKAQNNLYSKLELYVDYKRGVLKKSLLYKDNSLIQTIEIVEAQQMNNGAWLLKKLNKTPVLKSGNLVETAIYDNIQINIGLTDLDFDPSRQ